MIKKYWATVSLPCCYEKGFFEGYKDIGDWILELIPISKQKFEELESKKKEELRDHYPKMTLGEIVENFLNVVKVQDADPEFLIFLKESVGTREFHARRERTKK